MIYGYRFSAESQMIDFFFFFLHLVRSIIHEQGEAYDKSGCITSTLNVAKGNKKPLDLYLAETKADDGVQQNVGFLHICKLNFCSFHWICWGLKTNY